MRDNFVFSGIHKETKDPEQLIKDFTVMQLKIPDFPDAVKEIYHRVHLMRCKNPANKCPHPTKFEQFEQKQLVQLQGRKI